MSSICINTVARVGVGEVRRRMGTLASPPFEQQPISTRGGAGVVRRRVGTLASPNTHQPKMPHRITPSLCSGQALRHTCSEPFASAQGTLREEAAKGLSRWAERCFAALSMTAVACMLLPPAVTLSPCVALRGNSAKGLVLLAHGPDHALACAPSQHGHPYVEKRHVIFSMFAIALLFTLALFLFPLPVSAHTITNTGTGRIYGKLLNGTKRNAPVAGQSVTLQMAQGDNARDLTNVTTDTHGMFSFSGLNTDKTINYALYTLYQGAQYYTDLIDLSTKPVQQINLTIYDATTSVANIAIVQANVLIDKADAQKSLITISENFFFENLGTTTYVGSLQAIGSKPNALRFSLPNNARNLSLRSGFNGYQVIQVDPGFATDAALPPGTSQFAFSFQVPYTTSSYDFSYTIVYPTVNLSLLVPLNIHASSAAMDSQGPVNANQRTFQQFNAKKLLADSQIHVRLDGLPVSQPAANPQPLNQNTLWIILALLLMLAIVSVTWFIYRLSRRQSITRQKQTPQTSRRGGSGVDVGKGPLGRPASNMDARQRPLGRPASSSSNDAHPSQKDQHEALLQELLNLDKAYEAGTIKKVEYEERRSRTKTELRSLMNKDFVEKSTTTKKTARSSGKGVT